MPRYGHISSIPNCNIPLFHQMVQQDNDQISQLEPKHNTIINQLKKLFFFTQREKPSSLQHSIVFFYCFDSNENTTDFCQWMMAL